MISKISGTLVRVANDDATIAAEPFEYQVLIPEFTRRRLQSKIGESISLHTIQYMEGNPAQGRLIPRLVGFMEIVEREFFEMFCSVDGVGVRKALRAMVRPVRDVAILIEEQDAKGLSALPGVGPATSERIIAKLRRKMPKFALMVSHDEAVSTDAAPDLVRETFEALVSLGHSESDARKQIDTALGSGKKFKDVESVIRAIYDQSH